jgi:hypothetical protein
MIQKKLTEIFNNYAPLYKSVDNRIPKSWVANRSAFSIKGGYCYFRIPKCANSTVTKTLATYDSSISYDEVNDHDGRIAKNKFFNPFSATVFTKQQLFRKYFLFTFVRNPYSRLLSAYLDKINDNSRKYEATRKKIIEFSLNGEVTFDAFVTYLENGGLCENPHWVPQSLMLPISVSEIGFIGKVENIDSDLGVLINRLFGDDVYLEIISRQHNRYGAQQLVSDYFTENIKDRVYALYQIDFDNFKYPQDFQV